MGGEQNYVTQYWMNGAIGLWQYLWLNDYEMIYFKSY